MTTTLIRNLRRVNDEIAEAVQRAGRLAGSVKLIAVSKTHPAETVQLAISAGQLAFGENRVQDAVNKQAALAALQADTSSVEWHLIGHLQSNKARLVPQAFQWVHTVDSLELAKRISEAASKEGVTCQALIQVNVARDVSKHGIASVGLEPLVEAILESELEGLVLRGLMTIGKLDATEPEVHDAFATLRLLRDRIRERLALPEFNELSMGMSCDFPLAIAEGATMVRVGSAIFGDRGNR
jgi:PLP dependent protein